MLLEFRVKNFKVFKDETVFSMCATTQRDLDYSLLYTSNKKRILPTSVIYGPNASGKTNIILALEAFRTIVDRGHIKILLRGLP
jgi:AAA15 family ATPase/GTPase